MLISVWQGTIQPGPIRSDRNVEKRCNSQDCSSAGTVSKLPFLGKNERGRTQTSNKSEKLKLLWPITAFQDGRPPSTKGYSAGKRSDVDKLYIPRKLWGKGLKSLISTYECRIVSIKQHLLRSTNRNHYITKVIQHEKDKIVRVADELLSSAKVDQGDELTPRNISQKYLQYCLEQRRESYIMKPMHGYIAKKIENQNEIDHELTKSWTSNKYITSHFEGYAFAIKEQEINAKDLQYRRDKKSGKIPTINNRCRLCKYRVIELTFSSLVMNEYILCYVMVRYFFQYPSVRLLNIIELSVVVDTNNLNKGQYHLFIAFMRFLKRKVSFAWW